jgi:hypothetical protein
MLTENDLKIIAQLSYKETVAKFNEAISNRKIVFKKDLQAYLNIIMIINGN